MDERTEISGARRPTCALPHSPKRGPRPAGPTHNPPALAVHDLQVHVDPEDKHVALNAHLAEGGRGKGVGQRHQPHRAARPRVGVGEGRQPRAEAASDVYHLWRRRKSARIRPAGGRTKGSKLFYISRIAIPFSSQTVLLVVLKNLDGARNQGQGFPGGDAQPGRCFTL